MRFAWALVGWLALPHVALAEAPPTVPAPAVETATVADAPAYRNPEEAKALERLADEGQTASGTSVEPRSLGSQLLQTALMLVAICALAYLLLGKLLPRVMGMSTAGRHALLGSPSTGMVQVVDRLALDPRRTLMVVKVGDEHFLVGMTDQSMTQLARLDGSSLPEPPEAKPLLGAFGRLLERRLDKEGS